MCSDRITQNLSIAAAVAPPEPPLDSPQLSVFNPLNFPPHQPSEAAATKISSEFFRALCGQSRRSGAQSQNISAFFCVNLRPILELNLDIHARRQLPHQRVHRLRGRLQYVDQEPSPKGILRLLRQSVADISALICGQYQSLISMSTPDGSCRISISASTVFDIGSHLPLILSAARPP